MVDQSDAQRVRDDIAGRSAGWFRMGSPLMGKFARVVGARLHDGTATGAKMLAWRINRDDALPLRLSGGLHRLVLEGRAPDLAAVYGDPDVSDDELWAAIDQTMQRFDAELVGVLDLPPQTNEVRRSVAFRVAGHWLTERFGLPLVHSELGASAGLNMLWDQYGLDIAGQRFGLDDPALVLTPDWSGPLLADVRPVVAQRAGVDQNPLDADHDEMRILSYIWPDQRERLERTRLALKLAAKMKAVIAKGDAVDWLQRRLQHDFPGHVHLIGHTIVWQYFPEAERQRATTLLAEAGRRATKDAPLAHFGMENATDDPSCAAMTVQVWPSGQTFDLGRIDFHGRWVRHTPP
jgi:hypothetical protein